MPKSKGSSLALAAILLIIIGVGMTGAGVLLPNANINLPRLSSVTFSGVPIDLSFAGTCTAGSPFKITAYISESNMGPPQFIANAVLQFTITNASNHAMIANGQATSDDYGLAYWTWQNPAVGSYILSVDWVGDANHTAGGHTGNVPIGVTPKLVTTNPPVNPPSNSSQQHNQTVNPDPYSKYINVLTMPGLVLIVVGAAALPIAMRGKK